MERCVQRSRDEQTQKENERDSFRGKVERYVAASLGKAEKFDQLIPEEDEVRLTLLTTSNRKSSSSNNSNSFRKKERVRGYRQRRGCWRTI